MGVSQRLLAGDTPTLCRGDAHVANTYCDYQSDDGDDDGDDGGDGGGVGVGGANARTKARVGRFDFQLSLRCSCAHGVSYSSFRHVAVARGAPHPRAGAATLRPGRAVRAAARARRRRGRGGRRCASHVRARGCATAKRPSGTWWSALPARQLCVHRYGEAITASPLPTSSGWPRRAPTSGRSTHDKCIVGTECSSDDVFNPSYAL